MENVEVFERVTYKHFWKIERIFECSNFLHAFEHDIDVVFFKSGDLICRSPSENNNQS